MCDKQNQQEEPWENCEKGRTKNNGYTGVGMWEISNQCPNKEMKIKNA